MARSPLVITPSTRVSKKYVARFGDGKLVHFGGKGCGDFIVYSKLNADLAHKKRAAYIKRHGATESWRDARTPATLSRYILWEYPSLHKAVAAYVKKFKLV